MNRLEGTNDIIILSGEGDEGRLVRYTGKRTERALKARLTRERCHGDRWARAFIAVQEDLPFLADQIESRDYWELDDDLNVTGVQYTVPVNEIS
jgi:hypothetical protein